MLRVDFLKKVVHTLFIVKFRVNIKLPALLTGFRSMNNQGSWLLFNKGYITYIQYPAYFAIPLIITKKITINSSCLFMHERTAHLISKHMLWKVTVKLCFSFLVLALPATKCALPKIKTNSLIFIAI